MTKASIKKKNLFTSEEVKYLIQDARLKGEANLIIELQNAEVIDDIDAEHWYAQIETELNTLHGKED